MSRNAKKTAVSNSTPAVPLRNSSSPENVPGDKMATSGTFVQFKSSISKVFKENNVRSVIEPHRMLELCEELERLFTPEEREVSIDQFRETLHTKITSISSPLLFSQFWEDLIKHVFFTLTVLDIVHVDTVLSMVFECLRSAHAVELYEDYPATPPSSAKMLFTNIQRQACPQISNELVETNYKSLTSKERLHLFMQWKTEMLLYVERLDEFLSAHRDILEIHRLYVNIGREKAMKGVEQISQVLEKLSNLESVDAATYEKTFPPFRKALLNQFENVSDSERERLIQKLYDETDPHVRNAIVAISKQ